MLRLGVINYFHSAPFFNDGVILGSPKELKALFQKGELDASFLSAAYYLRHKETLTLIPQIGIGAEEQVDSVRFFYPIDMDEVDGRIILLDPESETANLLLKWLLKRRWRGTPHFITHDLVSDFTAYPHLMIGDRCLSHQTPDGYTYIDLASSWRQETSLPFLFAPLVARKGLPQNEILPLIERLMSAARSHPPVGKVTHILDDRYIASLNRFEQEIKDEQ